MMKLSKAIELLKDGKKLTYDEWKEDQFIYLDPQGIVRKQNNFAYEIWEGHIDSNATLDPDIDFDIYEPPFTIEEAQTAIESIIYSLRFDDQILMDKLIYNLEKIAKTLKGIK